MTDGGNLLLWDDMPMAPTERDLLGANVLAFIGIYNGYAEIDRSNKIAERLRQPQ